MLFFKQIRFFIVITLLCFINTQCDDDDSPITIDCEAQVEINEMLYENLETANFTFNLVNMSSANCLAIDFGASGCSGDTWTFNLVDSEIIAESSPEQRFIKFQLINNEGCLAVFRKEIQFNIESLQVEGSNEIMLNIEGYDEPILYSY